MITVSGRNPHAHLNGPGLDASARQRADALARATAGQMEAALALLSMLDPEAFEATCSPQPPFRAPQGSSSRRGTNAPGPDHGG
jgi:hypothetical protein